MPDYTPGRSSGRNFSHYRMSRPKPPEQKWFNTTIAPSPVLASLATLPAPNSILNPIPQGVTQSSRIGNEVHNRSVHIRLLLQRAAVDAVVRIIIVWNLDGSVTNPNLLLEDNTNFQSPLNKDYGKSFWVRFDKTYTLAAGQSQLQVDEIWRAVKCTTEYTDDGTTTPSANSLWLLAISNQATTANQPLLSYIARLTYTDE